MATITMIEKEVPLRVQLRRAERAKKIRYGALIAPLAIFLCLTFILPIIGLLKKGVFDASVSSTLPSTVKALDGWDTKELPATGAFQALTQDIQRGKGTPALAEAAKRLNMEQTGFISLFSKTGRHLPLSTGVDARTGLTDIDPRWSKLETWQAIARNRGTTTDYYLLASVDLHRDGSGGLAKSDSDFAEVFLRTFWMSTVCTFWCLMLGFPVAYMLARQSARVANLLMICVLLPFWTSVLVRVAAWAVLLQNSGLINQALLGLGIIHMPIQLVFNRFGVYVAMVHIMLPFVILPLYSVMKGISPSYVRAAVSLGCHPILSFWKVYFPLTLPGVAAGGLLVFILSMGYYITPALLGGPKEQMVSYFVAFFTNQTTNWAWRQPCRRCCLPGH